AYLTAQRIGHYECGVFIKLAQPAGCGVNRKSNADRARWSVGIKVGCHLKCDCGLADHRWRERRAVWAFKNAANREPCRALRIGICLGHQPGRQRLRWSWSDRLYCVGTLRFKG